MYIDIAFIKILIYINDYERVRKYGKIRNVVICKKIDLFIVLKVYKITKNDFLCSFICRTNKGMHLFINNINIMLVYITYYLKKK